MLVVDASVAIKFVTEEPGSEAAYDYVVGPEQLIAPDWILIESASAIYNKVKRSELLEIHAERDLAYLPKFFAKLFTSLDLLPEAFRLSLRLRHPVYDCLYLALALREDARLLTADVKFGKAAARASFGDGIVMLDWTKERPA